MSTAFNAYLATTSSAIDSFKNSLYSIIPHTYNAYVKQIWFLTSTLNNNPVSCRVWFSFYDTANNYWSTSYSNYDPSNYTYTFIQAGSITSSASNSGLTQGELDLLTLYYPVSEYYFYNNANITSIVQTYDTATTDYINNVTNNYINFPISQKADSTFGTLSHPNALNYKVGTTDVIKTYCSTIHYGIFSGSYTATFDVQKTYPAAKSAIAVLIGGGGGGGGGGNGGNEAFGYSAAGGGGGGMALTRITNPQKIRISVGYGGAGGEPNQSDFGVGNAGSNGGQTILINTNDRSITNSSDTYKGFKVTVSGGGGGGRGNFQGYGETAAGGYAGSFDYNYNSTQRDMQIIDCTQGSTGYDTTANTYPGATGGNGSSYHDSPFKNTGFTLVNSGTAGGPNFANNGTSATSTMYGAGAGGGAGQNGSGQTAGTGGTGGPGAVCIYFYT